MRKKQVLALLLSGALTVGMAPAAAFAAEEVSAVSVEDIETAAFEDADVQGEAAPETQLETQAETQPEVQPEAAGEPSSEPAVTEPDPSTQTTEPTTEPTTSAEPTTEPTEPAEPTTTDTPTVSPTDTPAGDPTVTPEVTPEGEPTGTPTTDPSGEATITPDASPSPSPAEEATKPFTLGENGYDTLAEAIAASTATEDDSEDIILMHQDLEIGETVVVPQGKNVIIAAAADKNVNITRKAGFTGNMFQVSGSMLQLGAEEDVDLEGNDIHGTLTVNGKGDGNTSAGSIVAVTDYGSFGLLSHGTLTGNNTSANGAAINCTEGIVMLSGGSITGNTTTAEGGAVYSESAVYVGGSVDISANTGAGAASGIVLKNDPEVTDPEEAAVIQVYDVLTTTSPIGVKLLNPAVGLPAVYVAADIDGMTAAQALAQFTYEDPAYTFDESGALKSTTPPVDVKLEVSLTGSKWLSTNRVQITGISTKDGDAYVKVVKKGSKAPSADQIIAENQKLKGGVTANKEFAFAHTFSKTEKTEVGSDAATVYICIKDAEKGETVVTSVDMNVTARPPKVTGVSKGTGWTGHNSANIVCVSDKSGSYYWGWSVRSDKSTSASSQAPEIDFTQPGVPVAANQNFTVYANDLDSDDPIDVYVYVKGEDGSVSAPVVAKLNQDNRPVNPTEAPSREPINPSVSESKVTGLENPLEFYPNTFYDFTVIGAGTQNTDPVEGDTRWVPLYWSMKTNPDDKDKHGSWKIGTQKGIKSADTYNLYIFFRQDRYNGREWQPTDSIVYQTYQFKSAAIEYALSPTPTVPAYGYDENGNPVDQYGNPIERTDDTTDTGATTATGARTADESPIGTMSMLAVLSLLAGGYVITRRRKKITD